MSFGWRFAMGARATRVAYHEPECRGVTGETPYHPRCFVNRGLTRRRSVLMAATYELETSVYRRGIRDTAYHLVATPLFLWAAALSVVAFCIRIVDLGSVPEWFTDEGFWTMPPRDFVLFADWAPTAYFHHYLSPLFSGLLAVWFRLLGPGILQARFLDSVIGVITIVLVVVLGAKLGSSKVGLLAAAALA